MSPALLSLPPLTAGGFGPAFAAGTCETETALPPKGHNRSCRNQFAAFSKDDSHETAFWEIDVAPLADGSVSQNRTSEEPRFWLAFHSGSDSELPFTAGLALTGKGHF